MTREDYTKLIIDKKSKIDKLQQEICDLRQAQTDLLIKTLGIKQGSVLNHGENQLYLIVKEYDNTTIGLKVKGVFINFIEDKLRIYENVTLINESWKVCTQDEITELSRKVRSIKSEVLSLITTKENYEFVL